MKQLIQNLKDGTTELVSTPLPFAKTNYIMVRNSSSLISVGTEKMLVEFGRSSYLAKARQQPDKVKQVIEKVKTDGLLTTYEAVKDKLEELKPLGNCSAGVVNAKGSGIEGFAVGDRVASNAPHAEINSVSKNLVACVPDNVTDEEAAFTVPGAIALQGIRLAEPLLGEKFVVIGTGLIGLLVVQILLANGCRVLALDYNQQRLEMAKGFGAEVFLLTENNNPIKEAIRFSSNRGVDGVILATATGSNKPVQYAAEMCRKRGRIILVGTADLKLYRDEFYNKELSFQVSCSYGPGRYDPNYEEKGQDYPFGYVRWTEQRNMEAVLDLISTGKIDVNSLISHRYPFEKALDAYEMILKGEEPYLGIILQYHNGDKLDNTKRIELDSSRVSEDKSINVTDCADEVSVGMIGAGEFSSRVLLPALKKTDAQLNTIVAGGGTSAALKGRKFGFEYASSNTLEVINNGTINTVFITTRHDSHGHYVLEALGAGKNVFVEKPLCLNLDELGAIKEFYNNVLEEKGEKAPNIMIGFNRRFSPFTVKIKDLLSNYSGPKSIVMTVNAGEIPADHWIQDPAVGGGRIIGEVCHFIDLVRHLVDSNVVNFNAIALDDPSDLKRTKDNLVINLSFADGSIANINYFSNGHKSYPKEKLELFCGAKVLVLDNFRQLSGYGWPGFKKIKSFRQQKGHEEEVAAFVNAVKNGDKAPISFDEIEEVTRLSILIDQKIRQS